MKATLKMPAFSVRLYGVFIAVFLEMHGLGRLFINLPYLLNAGLTSGTVLLSLLLLYHLSAGGTRLAANRGIGLGKTGFANLVPGLALSVLLLLFYPVLGWFLHTPIQMADAGLLNLAGLFLTGGLMEEAVFRGFLFGSLRRRGSFRRAALESMVGFALVHLLLFLYLDWPIALLSTILATGISIPLAYLYEKAGNTIWGAALVHASIRTIGLVFTTTEPQYQTLALAWMGVCLLVPWLVLLFDANFRKLWSAKPGAQPGLV